MSNIEREVSIPMIVKDFSSDALKKIVKEFALASDAAGRVGVAVQELQKRFKRIEVPATEVAEAAKKVKNAWKGFSSTLKSSGRRIAFTGFMMSALFRRMSKLIRFFGATIKGIIGEFSDFNKISEWLGETLKRLALGGRLNEETFARVQDTWNRAMNVSASLGAEMALLEEKFVDLKTVAARSTLAFVTQVNAKLGELNWEKVKTGVKKMADAFYKELLKAIDKIIDDDNLPKLLDNMETIGTLSGSFMAGVTDGVQDIVDSIVTIDDALGGPIGEDGAEGKGLKGIAYWAGEVTIKLAAMAIPLIAIGAATGLFGSAITGVKDAIKIFGGALDNVIAKMIETTGPAFPVAVVTVLGLLSSLNTDWDEHSKFIDAHILPAFRGLFDALLGDNNSVSEGLKSVGDLIDLLDEPFKIVITGIMVWVAILIRGLETIIRLLKQVMKLGKRKNVVEGSEGEDESGATTEHAGGLITRSGIYNLQAGERVISTRVQNNQNTGGIVININGARNPRETGREVVSRLRSAMVFV